MSGAIVERDDVKFKVRGPHRRKTKGKDAQDCVLEFEVHDSTGNRCRVEVPEFQSNPYEGDQGDAEAIAAHGAEWNKKRRDFMEREVFEKAVDAALETGFARRTTDDEEEPTEEQEQKADEGQAPTPGTGEGAGAA